MANSSAIIDANSRVTNYCLYNNITTQTTTTVKSGEGFLHAIDFTAAPSGVITIFDSLTGAGKAIRTITSPATLLQSEVNKILDIKFDIGLTIVTSGANQNIVVSYL